MQRPTEDHWQDGKRIVRYLAGNTTHGVIFAAKNTLTLYAFSDVDLASDSDDCLSKNAYILDMGTHPISWTSKKQKSVSKSAIEAEYRAVANTAAEL